MIDCRHVRAELARARTDGEVAAHLRECAACSRYSERLRAATELLRERQVSFEPDPGFAGRVVGALPAAPQMLGWAAVRLLPATLALVALLSVWVWMAAPARTTAMDSAPTDDVLHWVLEETGDSL